MDFSIKLNQFGLDKFSLSLKSRQVNLSVENDEKYKTHSRRKRKSPSNRKRSFLRRELFLRKKRDQQTSYTPDHQKPEGINSSGMAFRPTLEHTSESISCDNCDQTFRNSKNLYIHQTKLHKGNICQLDGQIDLPEEEDHEKFDKVEQILVKFNEDRRQLFKDTITGIVNDMANRVNRINDDMTNRISWKNDKFVKKKF